MINKAIRRHVHTIPTIEEKLPLLKNVSVHHCRCLRSFPHDLIGRRIRASHHLYGTRWPILFHANAVGISSGPEEYQRRQHEFLHGLPGVINIADDICIFGCGDTIEEANMDHDSNLLRLLDKCSDYDLHLSAKKLQFKVTSLSWGTD